MSQHEPNGCSSRVTREMPVRALMVAVEDVNAGGMPRRTPRVSPASRQVIVDRR